LLFWLWHWASLVQPAEPAMQWPLEVSHWLPPEQSLLDVQSPQKPLTQPNPPHVEASVQD
jgi:hypothetical protein